MQQFYPCYRKLSFTVFLILTVLFGNAQICTNNWYVGNTEAGEWIKYKKVWLSAGTYRFTARAVSKSANQTAHLEINNQTLQSNIAIPNNGLDTFGLVHLGHTSLTTGYYDLKLVFETGNVACDMIFIRKDNNTSNTVSTDDTQYSINRNDGMHVVPITAQDYTSASLSGLANNNISDNNGNKYTHAQILAWYKQQYHMFTPNVTDEGMDQWVSELVASKPDFLFMHGRGQVDFTNEVEDRDYYSASGNYDPRYLKKFAEAVNRSPYAKGNIKLAYFQDNPAYFGIYKSKTGKTANWGDTTFQSFIWNYSFKPWFDNVPGDMLYEYKPGVVPVQVWSEGGAPDYDYNVQDHKILEFYTYIKNQMISTYGITPYFCFGRGFTNRDPRVYALQDGLQVWFGWGGWISSMDTLKGKTYAFTTNGKKYPLAGVWLNDWDPISNTGTAVKDGNDYHTSALLPDGTEAIRSIFEQGRAANAEWIVEESWDDWQEGTTWYRSDHPEYAYPNQYVAINREFADRNSGSIVLEAEDCDEFFDKSTGNSGGSYRFQWYTNKDVDLDIYRPLHLLSNFQSEGKPATPLKNFSVGFQDNWGFDANGKIYCHEADGIPINWQTATSQRALKDIAIGDRAAWAIGIDNNVYHTTLPGAWTQNNSTGWTNVTDGQPMKDIDLNLKEVWGVDSAGKVYYRDMNAVNSWVLVPGNMTNITADNEWIWGLTSTGRLARMSEETKAKWDSLDNPHNLSKIDAGAGEVWGVNAKKEVYRISSSGEGKWQLVTTGYTNVSVGYEFAWLSDSVGNMYRYKIVGFETKAIFGIIPPAPATIPVVTSADTARGVVAFAFSYNITGTSYHTSYDAPGLPAGLKLNRATGEISGFPLTAGTFSVTVSVTNEAGTGSKPLVIIITSSTPYSGSPINIPSKVEVENFDNGGQNVAYYDNTPTNVSGKYRTSEAVDIETCSEGGFDIGNIGAGEWMNYSVNVTAAGTYTLQARIASPTTSGNLHIELDGVNISGAMKVPNTGSYQTWQNVSVTTPVLTTGPHMLRIVIDATGFNVNYINFNNAPAISSTLAMMDTVNTSFSYKITASNTPTSYNATSLPAGLSVNTATGLINGTPTTPGTYNVVISATNASGTDTKTLVITIVPPAPVITSALTATAAANASFTYTITASNTPTSYAATNLPTGLSINTSTGVISGTVLSSGTYNTTISATNASGTATATLAISITVPVSETAYSGTPINIPGRVELENFDNGGEGIAYHDNDVTNNGAKYRTTEGVDIQTCSEGGYNIGWGNTGEWMKYLVNVTTAGSFTLQVRASAGGSSGVLHVELDGVDITGPIKITATGGNQTWQSFSVATLPLSTGQKVMRVVTDVSGFNLNYIDVNTSPIIKITSANTITNNINTSFNYTITTSGSATGYTSSKVPSGLSFNSSTGVISGVPTVAGTYKDTVTATNGINTDTKIISIVIVQPVPVITSADTISNSIGVPFSYTISANNNPLSFDAACLPPGLTVNTTTGIISGTPTQAGVFEVILSATNVQGTGFSRTGGLGSKTLVITITEINTGTLINNDVKGSGIVVYPNPAEAGGTINIQFADQDAEKYQIRFYNYLGQTVYETTINKSGGVLTYQLLLQQNMPAGLYQLEVTGSNDIRFQNKIILNN